jgi:NitT/TauT family transport system substrate-binding protein
MNKKLISMMLVLGMTASFAVGCANQNTQETNEEVSATINVDYSQMSEEELQAAWEQEPAYGETLTLGYNGGLCLGAFGVAQEKGFYEEQGLKTEIISVNSVIDALGTGQIVAGGDHIATTLVPAVNGVNMTFTRGANTGCKSLYALADSEVEKTADLVGQTVAVADGIGASDQNISMRFFNKDGVDVNDIKWKVVDNSAVILALQNGEIQAATLSDQFAKKFLEDGTLKVIRSLTYDEDFSQETCCVHAINSDFLKENPITSYKLNLAHENASNWIEDNKEEFVDILLDNSWASGEADFLVSMAKDYSFRITDDATEVTLENILNDYKKFGTIDSSVDTETALNKLWVPLAQQ